MYAILFLCESRDALFRKWAPRAMHRAPDAAQDLAAGSRWEVSASPPREDIAAGLRRSTRSNFGMGPPSSPASAPGESRGRNRQRARRRAVSCEAPSRRNRLPRRPGALAVASQETASVSPSGSQASASPSDSQASASPRSAGASRAKIPDKETLLLYASLTQAEAAGKLGCSIRTVQIACRQYDFQWPRGRRRTKKLTEDQARSIFSERARGEKASVLADRYGVSDQMVRQIVRKKSWQNATRHVFTSTL